MSTLKRELGVLEVFSISSGAMISSGIFVLPAVVYSQTGPSMLLSYFFAALLMIPAMFAQTELATAMPKSGGTYFYITRSFGGLYGTFTGIANWFSVMLKSAFALVGIGVFLKPLIPVYSQDMITIIACVFSVLFTILNILSVKESGRSQIYMVVFLFIAFAAFIVLGLPKVDVHEFSPFMTHGWRGTLYVTGMIFISYGGLTKIASIAEEIRNPGKTIPLGMIAAFTVVSVLYLLSIFVVVGVLDHALLIKSPYPLSSAANVFLGTPGFILLAFAGIAAFVTTANAGMLAASRSPLAMARDGLIPSWMGFVSKKTNTPVAAILITSLSMILFIIFLDIESLVKAASAMMLVLFASSNLSVLIMRWSKIVSYRPVFKSPLFPYIQIGGIVLYLVLIMQMGLMPVLFMCATFLFSIVWYFAYGKKRSENDSAFVHMVEGIAKPDFVSTENDLTDELLDILRERDSIEEDRFDTIIRSSFILDMKETCDRDQLFSLLSEIVGKRWHLDPEGIKRKLNIREEEASTLIYPGVAVPHAIPHIVMDGEHRFDIVPVRNRYGIKWNENGDIVYTAFCLIGTKDERNFHLKALMSIAQILQDPDFHSQWMKSRSEQELRSILLLTSRRRHTG